ncbi:MAG: SDR family oxidoreductase [Verrucomicrobia bacterium]|nr:SDR family oxidoreductase [Verrucomicrobiota bacterium]
MVEKDKTYVVMGLLDQDSIAYAIGRTIESQGGKVVYTVQNERMKKLFIDSRRSKMTEDERAGLNIRFCDITIQDEVVALFRDIGPISGVVHSIAFANPQTCLGTEFHTDAVDDIKLAHHISCISLATVARFAQPAMAEGGSIVAMTFNTKYVFPFYNWMGVQKAALEALVKALARRHGRDHVRVNAVSAGPLATMAASKIPGFSEMANHWDRASPLPWDPVADKQAVANAVVYMLGQFSKKITGQVLYVDGGASIMGGDLLDHERAKPA